MVTSSYGINEKVSEVLKRKKSSDRRKISLMAPTGRASRRMAESTGMDKGSC